MGGRSVSARVIAIAWVVAALHSGTAIAKSPTPTPTPVSAPTPAASPATTPAPAKSAVRRASPLAGGWQAHLSFLSAGPLLFRDVPDRRLEPTTVFEYGGAATFLMGEETVKPVRFGGGLSFVSVARSPTRSLQLASPYFAAELGHPLALRLEVGPALGVGSGDWTSRYSGLSTGALLRYSFRQPTQLQPMSVSIGPNGRFVASVNDFTRSSAFLGAQVDVAYHSVHGKTR